MSKIYKILIIILLFAVSNSYAQIDKPLIDVDFNESNGLDLLQKYNIEFAQSPRLVKIKLELLRKNYQQFKPSKMERNITPLIPKTIHLIWLGHEPLPKNYQYYLTTWRKFHPNWQIKIWNEEDYLKESFLSNDLYWQAESYAEKADIMRYEILYKYGGLYIDTDIECFANFDELHHKYDFYINMEPPIINKGTIQMVNAMIGAAPNNPIFLRTLEKIRKDWDATTDMFTKAFANYPRRDPRSKHHLAVRRTMIPLSDIIFDSLLYQDLPNHKIIILPIGYNMSIYPINEDYSSQTIIRPETRSSHHYNKENSFMTNPGFMSSLFNFKIILENEVEVFEWQRNIFLNFQDLFRDNFPTKISFDSIAQIPEVIYLHNNSNFSEQELLKLKEEWQQKNQFFIVNIITDKELMSYLPSLLKMQDPQILKFIAPFYLLNNKGGVYVEASFKPADLQEFHYKYKYYAPLKTIMNLKDLLSMDTSFIAAKANHIIISRLLQDFEKSDNITCEQIKGIYLENAYKYNLLDGKNILFPEIIFDQKR